MFLTSNATDPGAASEDVVGFADTPPPIASFLTVGFFYVEKQHSWLSSYLWVKHV